MHMQRRDVVNWAQLNADTDDNWRRRAPTTTRHSPPPPETEREIPAFKDQRVIGNFKTKQESPPLTPMRLVVTEPEVRPRLLLPEAMIASMNGRCLDVKYDERHFVTDYRALHGVKQAYFYRWLVDHSYFQNVGVGKKWKRPDFIGNVGRIVDALLTPLNVFNKTSKKWLFYAIKYQDIIFLSSVDFGDRRVSTRESHCGSVYRSMITGGNPESKIINEFEKLSAATEVTFGNHQLLIVGGSVEDDKGNSIKIRAYRPKQMYKYQIAKFVKFWGASVVPGVKTFVLGDRDDNRVLRSTEYIPTKDLLTRTGLEGHEKSCYKYTNEVLDLVKQQFNSNDRSIVKLFSWNPQNAGEPRLPNIIPIDDPAEIQRVSQLMLPDWFVQGAFDE